MIKNFLIISVATLALTACSGAKDAASAVKDSADAAVEKTADAASAVKDTAVAVKDAATSGAADTAKLSAIIAAQPEAIKARYNARHPQETLAFFGVKPGMTIVEVLPGGGWYTKMVGPYLGRSGHIVGVDYSLDMWPEFGGFATPEFIENRKSWAAGWEKDMKAAGGSEMSQVSGYTMGKIPAQFQGKADMVLLVRALHNLARFNAKGGYMDAALSELYGTLKPGGIVGIVQHQAPDENADDWADGNNGYLKKSYVIAQMEKAGFEYSGESAVNENSRDKPTTDDDVWRLPPTLGTSREKPELKAKMETIGESNRMTLKFVKPS